MKERVEMDFKELVTLQAGEALMSLGGGATMKSIIWDAMNEALLWKQERDAAGKGVVNKGK